MLPELSMSPYRDLPPRFMHSYCFSVAGTGNGRGNAIFNEFRAEHKIVTLAWFDNASLQFRLKSMQLNGAYSMPLCSVFSFVLFAHFGANHL